MVIGSIPIAGFYLYDALNIWPSTYAPSNGEKLHSIFNLSSRTEAASGLTSFFLPPSLQQKPAQVFSFPPKGIMSDEEHHFESKADAGAAKTYPQQANTFRDNGYIVINNRPCKVKRVVRFKTGPLYHLPKCLFVARDIFTAKNLEVIVPSSHICDVPYVNRTDYQLIDISEDGFVSLRTKSGGTKDDVRLPTDDSLLTTVIKDGISKGKDLVVSVMSAMGEEHIFAAKENGSNSNWITLAGDYFEDLDFEYLYPTSYYGLQENTLVETDSGTEDQVAILV